MTNGTLLNEEPDRIAISLAYHTGFAEGLRFILEAECPVPSGDVEPKGFEGEY